MKYKKIIITIALFFITLLIPNISNAYTVTVDNIRAKQGEEFTVTLNVSEETPLADGHIKFDKSKVEFIKATQNGMTASEKDDGDIAWMYIDETAFSETDIKGVNSFEFIFKAKTSKESEIAFQDLEFVDINRNEYTMYNLQNSKTTLYVNKSNSKIIIIAVVAVILIIIAILRMKLKK